MAQTPQYPHNASPSDAVMVQVTDPGNTSGGAQPLGTTEYSTIADLKTAIGGGAVTSVNGVAPVGGAVTLTAADVGADASGAAASRAAVAGDIGGTASAPEVTGINGQPVATGAAWQALGGSHGSHLSGWLSVLGSRHTSQVLVACIGDSCTSGYDPGITDWSQSWPARLGVLAQQRYPSIGQPDHGRGLLLPVLAGGLTPSWITAKAGTPTLIYNTGLVLNAFEMSSGVSWTYSLVGTSAFLFYGLQPGGGNFTCSVDGGAATTVTTANATASDTGFQSITLGATPGEAHTLTIAYVAGSGPVQFDGLAENNGDENAGIQVWNCGYSGSTAQGWAATDFTIWGIVQVPVLFVIELGVNDWQAAGRTSAQVKADLETIISTLRTDAGSPGGVNWARGFLLAPVWLETLVTEAEPWSNYVDVMYEIAAANGDVDVLDWTAGRMPPMTAGNQPNDYYDATSGELTPVGHAVVADFTLAYLGPQ